MLMRAVIYIKSAYTQDQVDNFLVHLRDTVVARSWTVVAVQVDRTIGVTKARNRLTGLAAILGAIARCEVDPQGCSTLSSWTGESEMQHADANRRRVAA